MARDPIAEIIAGARRRGLDPNAVLAVASVEGLSGGIGDHGTSFGPWQLHSGGALPRGIKNPHQWAWSKQGINYGLDRIAGVAAGQRGRQAVASIVHGFERPADPVGEVQRAMGVYGRRGGRVGGLVAPTAPPARGPQRGAVPAGGLDFGSIIGQTNEIVGLPSSGILRFAPGPMSQRAKQGGFGPPVQVEGATSSRGKKAATLVQHYLGTPYVWGGTKPGAFDCSGLLQYVWGKVGVKIPRVTYGQWKAGQPVGKKQLKPGDAVFFHAGAQGPEHVGMYIGGGEFIEAPHTGAVVRISKLAGRVDYLGARRYG